MGVRNDNVSVVTGVSNRVLPLIRVSDLINLAKLIKLRETFLEEKLKSIFVETR